MNLKSRLHGTSLVQNIPLACFSVAILGQTFLGISVYNRIDYAFTNYVFGDIGASWHAVELIARNKLPGVDYAYQYGALSLRIFDLALDFLGRSPTGCYNFGMACTWLMAVGLIGFACRVKAAWPAVLPALFWVVASERIVFLSSAHALEPLVLSAAVLAAMGNRPRLGIALCVVGWFIKPAMAIVLLSLIVARRFLDIHPLKHYCKGLMGDLLTAVVTGLGCFAVTAAWLGWQSAASMLVPIQGVGVYKASNFGFFHGSGSLFYYMPGAGPGYYFGTQSASWLAINGFLLILSIFILCGWFQRKRRDRTYRDELGEWTVIFVIAHSAFVAGFYGTLWTWTYYAWLMWMGLVAGLTWLTTRCPHGKRAAIGLAFFFSAISIVGNYANYKQLRDSLKSDQPLEQKYGTFASPEFIEAWNEMSRLLSGDGPITISLTMGNGGSILGHPWVSPDYWCIAPGDSFKPMFAERDRAMDQSSFIVLFMHQTLDSYPETRKRLESQFERVYFKTVAPSQLELWKRRSEGAQVSGRVTKE